MKTTLFDVQWCDELVRELDKMLAEFRLIPVTPDDGLHTIFDAVKHERGLRATAIQQIRLYLERHRAECVDLETADRIAEFKAKWDRAGGEEQEAWTTPARLCVAFDLSSPAMHKRLTHRDCPYYDAERGESGRIIKLKLNAELREWLQRGKQPGTLMLACAGPAPGDSRCG